MDGESRPRPFFPERESMKKEAIIDAVIPAYRPGAEFRELLKRLMAQSRPLRRIIIMNTRMK